MASKIQLRNDTSENWVTYNPILAEGELGVETDTKKIKVGNGINTWDDLGYISAEVALSIASATTLGGIKIGSGLSIDESGVVTASVPDVSGQISTHNTSETAHSDIRTALSNKVDTVSGKGLSTNDLTNELKVSYDGAVTNSHTHSNKTILDNTTASFTTAKETLLSSFNGASQLVQLDSSGKLPAVDGSNLTGISTGIDKNVTKLGTCSTASATAEKAVTVGGFTLTAGATIEVTFTNANTATGVTINVNSTGANPLTDLKGNAITYVPANTNLNLFYNGTNWILLYSPDYDIPDYTAGVALTASTSNQTIANSGWLRVGTYNQNVDFYINNVVVWSAGSNDIASIWIKIKKGDTYKFSSVNFGATFYPYRNF